MTNPHWRIWVDWNENGTWGESSGNYREDVTGDVLDLDWRWGQRVALASERKRNEPARLALTLGNADRRYTPGNAQSPLAGNLSNGRKVWASMAYPYDDFAGADGTDLDGRAAPAGENQAWAKASTGPAGIALTRGRAQPTAGSGGAIYALDFGDADPNIGFVYRRSGNGVSGIALRVLSQWDYLRIRFGATGTVLEDVTFGFPSTLNRGDPLTAGRDYFLEVQLHGNSVRLYATDLSGGAMDRREILDGVGIAGNATGTKHGLWHDGSTAAGGDRWSDFGGWRSFFHGSLVRISPERDPELGYVCRLEARDELELLNRRPLYNLLNQRLLSTRAIANSILTWAGFSPNYRRLDAGRTLVATEPRALWRVAAGAALDDLADEENGRIYVDGRGYFRLEDSDHRQGGPQTTVRATLRDTRGSAPYVSELEWDEGRAEVENSVAFRYRLAVNQGLQEIWRLRDVPAIPAGESRDFLAESGSYDAVDSIRLPAATTDYSANARSDGSGTDLTGSVTVALPYAPGGSLATPSDTYRGRGTVVRVTNGHATSIAYLTLLRLMADRSYQAPEPTSYRTEDAASQLTYGIRAETVECRFIDNYEAARLGAEARLTERRSPKARLALTLPNGGGANLSQIVHRVLSDRIKVVSSYPNIDGDFFIEGMELKARARTGEVTARWLVKEV